MNKDIYSDFVNATNISGSGKATSYIRALDLLSEMLQIEAYGFDDCIDIWNVSSVKRIDELKAIILVEKNQGKDSKWLSTGLAQSYLLKGYCNAALTDYAKFLNQEDQLIGVFQQHQGSALDLAKLLDRGIDNADGFINSLVEQKGEDVIRRVKVRLNQSVFRKMIMRIYHNSCCITGLNIPQLNRASHIIPWAEDESKRLDPSNGLYLSATYDAAFDSKLISLDNDYRVIVSKDITEHYTRDSVNEYFLKIEGKKITLPAKYLPEISYLEKHRLNGSFR